MQMRADCYPTITGYVFFILTELEEQANFVDLVAIQIEDLNRFEDLTLGLLQEDGLRQEELKTLKDPKVFMLVVL